MAGGSWREGPAREGRRRLQEVRTAAQRETAEWPAESRHGLPRRGYVRDPSRSCRLAPQWQVPPLPTRTRLPVRFDPRRHAF